MEKTEPYRYEPAMNDYNELLRMHASGRRIVCPVCGADLIIALDPKTVEKYQVHPGIYCPRNRSHIAEMVELAPVRERFRRWMESRQRAEEDVQG